VTALFEITGVIDAPVPAVADLLFRVRPGQVGTDNAVLLAATGSSITLTGGPDRFVAAGAGHRMTVEIDRARPAIAVQGGWWYRGEYALVPGPDQGTRVIYRIFNVADRARWAVPLANRFFIGFERDARRAFATTIREIGGRLGRPTRVD
jgi:hypothetical protein